MSNDTSVYGSFASPIYKLLEDTRESGTIGAGMKVEKDVRAVFYLASFLASEKSAERTASRLAERDVGIIRIGDIQQLSLQKVRDTLNRVAINPKEQQTFLRSLCEANIFPSDIASEEEFEKQI